MEDCYLEKLKKSIKGRTFLYIDAANLEKSVSDIWVNAKDIPDELKGSIAENLHYSVDYKEFKKTFSSLCDLKEIKFYTADFETENHRKFLFFMNKKGYKLSTKKVKNYKDHTVEHPHRKANFDVEIAVDTILKINKFDTLILFSGDCDFEYLIKKLKGISKIVIVFSRQGHIAKELPPASSYYFDIIDFRKEFLKINIKKDKAKNPAI